MSYSISTELIVEDIEIIEVVLIFLLRIFNDRVVIYQFLDVSLKSITIFFYFSFSACTPIFVFVFHILLLSHKFRKLQNSSTDRVLMLMIKWLLKLLLPLSLKSIQILFLLNCFWYLILFFFNLLTIELILLRFYELLNWCIFTFYSLILTLIFSNHNFL